MDTGSSSVVTILTELPSPHMTLNVLRVAFELFKIPVTLCAVILSLMSFE